MKQKPYTPDQVIENLKLLDQRLFAYDPNLSAGPGWVRGIIRDILKRGIATPKPKRH